MRARHSWRLSPSHTFVKPTAVKRTYYYLYFKKTIVIFSFVPLILRLDPPGNAPALARC
jgi:hypothetical protein